MQKAWRERDHLDMKHNDRYGCTTKSGVFCIEEKYFEPL
jgi:hypothetical protein